MWRWGAHDCIPIMYIGREGKQKGNSFHRARRSDTSKETEKREIEKKRNSEKNRREGKQKGTRSIGRGGGHVRRGGGQLIN